jgi:hypothetical protein
MKVRFLVECIIGEKRYYPESVYALDDDLAIKLLNLDPPAVSVLVQKSLGGAPENKMQTFSQHNKGKKYEIPKLS